MRAIRPGCCGGYHFAPRDRSPMLRFVLIGCGRIGRRHADLLAYSVDGGELLAGVCDPVAERRAAFAEKYSVPAFASIGDVVASGRFDVAVVCTPSGLHALHAVELLEGGMHVIVEKPMALTLADADAMMAAAERSGKRLFVVKQNRFNRPVQKLREALEAGRLGKLVLATVRVRWCRRQPYYDADAWRGTWALDGGVLANQASHHVDLLQWMLGDVESVTAVGRTALAKIETEDVAAAVVKFTSGALGIIEATTCARPTDLEGSLSVLGSEGTVEIGGFAVNELKVWRFEQQTTEDESVIASCSVNPPDVYGFGHAAYYADVVDALKTGRRALVEGPEGRRSLELVVALYESMASGATASLPMGAPRHTKLGKRV